MLESLKTHGDLHLARKAFHVGCLMFIFILMLLLPRWICWVLYATVGVPMILIDYFRRYSPKLNTLFLKVVGPFLRKHEARKLSGSSYAGIGVGLVFLIFPKPTCLLAVLFLGIGDPTASLFGLLYGKKKIFGKKSVVGSFAAFVACSIATFIFLCFYMISSQHSGFTYVISLSLACGAIAAVSELVSFFNLDDNLTQPLVSASLLSLLFWQIGGIVYG